jgi:hypothetical protein
MYRAQSDKGAAASRSTRFGKMPASTAFAAMTGAGGGRLSDVVPEASVNAGTCAGKA